MRHLACSSQFNRVIGLMRGHDGLHAGGRSPLGILAAKLDTACGPYQLKKLLFVSDALPIEVDGYGGNPVGFRRARGTFLLVADRVVDRLADTEIPGCQGLVGWLYPLFSHRFILHWNDKRKR
jgi:hypothetical protein